MAGVIEWFASLSVYEKIALPLGAAFFMWLGKKIGYGLKMVFLKETNEKISVVQDQVAAVKSTQDTLVQKMADHSEHSSEGFKRLDKSIDRLEGFLMQRLDKTGKDK